MLARTNFYHACEWKLNKNVLELIEFYPEKMQHCIDIQTLQPIGQVAYQRWSLLNRGWTPGLKANEKGQVKAESSLLQQFQAIGEESGLSCVICRYSIWKMQLHSGAENFGKVIFRRIITRGCSLWGCCWTCATQSRKCFRTVNDFIGGGGGGG